MLEKIEKFLAGQIRGGRAFLSLFVLSALFVAPILFAGVDYVDDTARKLEGAYQWGALGRVITEGLMHVLTFNFGTMTDPGNFMQLLCIPFLALTAYVIAKMVSDGRKLAVLDIFIGAQFIPNQLLLTNLSFRFDSLSMILGNLAAVTAAYVLVRKGGNQYSSVVVAALLVFIAAGLYQSTVLMFGVVTVVALVARYVARSEIRLYPTALKALVALIAGSLLYVAMLKLFQFKGLTGQRKEIVPFNSEGIDIVFHNFKVGIKTILQFVSNIEMFILAVFVGVALMVSLALVVYHYARKRPILDTLLVALSPVFVVLCIMGPFVLMLASNLTTQVRVLTGVIGVMLLATVAVVALYKSGRRWALWLLVAPLLMNLYSLSFAYVYGSTLKAQRAFDETVYETIVAAIEESPSLQSSMIFIGGEPASPLAVRTQFEKRPALKQMDITGDNTRWYLWQRLHDEGVGGGIDAFSGKHSSRIAVDVICSQTSPAIPLVENEFFVIYPALEDSYILWLRNPASNTGHLCSEV